MKLRTVIFIISICFGVIQSRANTYSNDASNTLYIDAVTASPGGQVTLTIKMKNNVSISGFQLDLNLPDGITVDYSTDTWGDVVITSAMSSVRANAANFTYSASFPETNNYRHATVLCYATNKSIAAGDGEVATITLNVDKSVAAADYDITLQNIVISNTSDTYETTTNVISKLTVGAMTKLDGDMNHDGQLTVEDVSLLIKKILNME